MQCRLLGRSSAMKTGGSCPLLICRLMLLTYITPEPPLPDLSASAATPALELLSPCIEGDCSVEWQSSSLSSDEPAASSITSARDARVVRASPLVAADRSALQEYPASANHQALDARNACPRQSILGSGYDLNAPRYGSAHLVWAPPSASAAASAAYVMRVPGERRGCEQTAAPTMHELH